jgi:hypothetical protein
MMGIFLVFSIMKTCALANIETSNDEMRSCIEVHGTKGAAADVTLKGIWKWRIASLLLSLSAVSPRLSLIVGSGATAAITLAEVSGWQQGLIIV